MRYFKESQKNLSTAPFLVRSFSHVIELTYLIDTITYIRPTVEGNDKFNYRARYDMPGHLLSYCLENIMSFISVE